MNPRMGSAGVGAPPQMHGGPSGGPMPNGQQFQQQQQQQQFRMQSHRPQNTSQHQQHVPHSLQPGQPQQQLPQSQPQQQLPQSQPQQMMHHQIPYGYPYMIQPPYTGFQQVQFNQHMRYTYPGPQMDPQRHPRFLLAPQAPMPMQPGPGHHMPPHVQQIQANQRVDHSHKQPGHHMPPHVQQIQANQRVDHSHKQPGQHTAPQRYPTNPNVTPFDGPNVPQQQVTGREAPTTVMHPNAPPFTVQTHVQSEPNATHMHPQGNMFPQPNQVKPYEKREKKILTFVDPNTGKPVDLNDDVKSPTNSGEEGPSGKKPVPSGKEKESSEPKQDKTVTINKGVAIEFQNQIVQANASPGPVDKETTPVTTYDKKRDPQPIASKGDAVRPVSPEKSPSPVIASKAEDEKISVVKSPSPAPSLPVTSTLTVAPSSSSKPIEPERSSSSSDVSIEQEPSSQPLESPKGVTPTPVQPEVSDDTDVEPQPEPTLSTPDEEVSHETIQVNGDQDSPLQDQEEEEPSLPSSPSPSISDSLSPDSRAKAMKEIEESFQRNGKWLYTNLELGTIRTRIGNVTCVVDKEKMKILEELRTNSTQHSNTFLPQFVHSTSRSSGGGGGQGGGGGSRNGSQSRQPYGGRMSNNPKEQPKKVIAAPTLAAEVKLHQSQNAWKPEVSALKKGKGEELPEEEAKTVELLKTFRGFLNKITPQKYDVIEGRIKELAIDTRERMEKILNLVFDKAIDEPAFCIQYAKLCTYLATISLKSDDGSEHGFRRLLLTKCQKDFERNIYEGIDVDGRGKDIDECDDPDKKKSLTAELDEEKRRARKKSLGNIKLIGELYRLSLLRGSIMMTCITQLISNRDDESLECLCTLLRTIGKQLEADVATRKDNRDTLNQIMDNMASIVTQKTTTSSRIRFLIQDILDMRKNQWEERFVQKDNRPKTIDEIRAEATDQERKRVADSINDERRRIDNRATKGMSQSLNLPSPRKSQNQVNEILSNLNLLTKKGQMPGPKDSLGPSLGNRWQSSGQQRTSMVTPLPSTTSSSTQLASSSSASSLSASNPNNNTSSSTPSPSNSNPDQTISTPNRFNLLDDSSTPDVQD